MIDRIYIHFSDYYHTRRAAQNGAHEADIRRALEWSFRLALLFSKEVVFPASSIFESARCRDLISNYPEFRANGLIRMAAGDANILDYLEGRAKAYDASSPRELLRAYSLKNASGLPSFDEKRGSSTVAIRERWLSLGSDDTHYGELASRSGESLPPKHAHIWNDLPDRLGLRAFIPAHAMQLLLKEGFNPRIAPEVDLAIESAYIQGYAHALDAGLLVDVPFLAWRALESNLHGTPSYSYLTLNEAIARHFLCTVVSKAASADLFALVAQPEWQVFAACVTIGRPVEEPEALRRRVMACLEPKEVQSLFFAQEKKMDDDDDEELRGSVRTAILTALPIEFAAVRKLLPAGKRLRVKGDPNLYYLAKAFVGTEFEQIIVVCLLTRMGNEAAATASASLHRSFENVEDLVFCGIALGVPNTADPGKHVRLGDVVVSDRRGVIHTGFLARRPDGDENRSQLPPPPARLVNAVNQLETDILLGSDDWSEAAAGIEAEDRTFARPDLETDVVLDEERNIKAHPVQPNRVEGRPLLHRGAIGSSDVLVKDGKFRDDIASEHGIIAMEMEGAGAVEASWTFGKYAMIVRGISDYGAGKTDTWQGYASLVAAAATLALIERV